MKQNNNEFDELVTLLEERGSRVLARFRQASLLGVNAPGLISILEQVNVRWKDVYRPALASICCEAVGGHQQSTDNVALMITLASAGGGLHDDIIDKSSDKHFRMTILGLYGTDKALVAGDLLILKGWTMVREVLKKGWKPKKIFDVVEAFGSWTVEVCESEFMEITCRRNLGTDLEYYKKALWMSMADTEACAKLGAIIGDGSEHEVRALAEFGRRLGFMFRLADDVKDTFNTEGNLPHRLEYESVPMPLLFSAKSSKRINSKIESILNNPPATPSDISALLGFCFETSAFSYIDNLAKQNMRQAYRLLYMIKPSKARSLLELMIKKPFTDIAALCS